MNRLLCMAMIAALVAQARADAPTGLLCELLAQPGRTTIATARPKFGWIVPLTVPGDFQTAYQIIVSSDDGQVWDSGKVESRQSIDVEYGGEALATNTRYVWKSRTWNRNGAASDWSAQQEFGTAGEFDEDHVARYPLETTPIAPVLVERREDHYFIDFGKAAFGWLELEIDSPIAQSIEVHLGEAIDGERVHRKPGGTIRYASATVELSPGKKRYRVETPADKRNTSGKAILLPEELGVILPFRYVEVHHSPVALDEASARQVAVMYPFDDDAADFTSSDENLNAIWDLCKYSIKATTAFGVYVDGDRERIPYEADAYINQLCHYFTDREFAIARYSHEYLMDNPTWPTEWKQHSVLMAHADWMHTGNLDSVRRCYDMLKSEKTLTRYAREDGLLDTRELRDIVDWPAGERDGYVMSPVNAVVNAFHYRTLVLMAEMADAIGKPEDTRMFRDEAQRVYEAFNAKLFDEARGIYIDGENIEHAALHANVFPLAFGLVPEDRKPGVIEFIKSRGMACSVYAAQYLLEALYENSEADYAMSLILADDDRGWLNMIHTGSTITLEAWDIKYKPNLDWNHAWGAAPANILPRYVLGVRPLEAGFGKVLIQPQLSGLRQVEGIIPTIRGPVQVRIDNDSTNPRLEVSLPANMTGTVVLPWSGETRQVTSGRHVFVSE